MTELSLTLYLLTGLIPASLVYIVLRFSSSDVFSDEFNLLYDIPIILVLSVLGPITLVASIIILIFLILSLGDENV